MVLVTESRQIARATVPGLLEAFQDAFRHPYKVELLLYKRGEPTFTVERLVPEASIPKEDGDPTVAFLTPFQMIRQHAELEIQEESSVSLLERISHAVQSLTVRGFKFTMLVCGDKMQLRRATPLLRVEDVWQVQLYEDPEAPVDKVFVIGSKSGAQLQDIETAVLCSFEVVP